MGYRLRMPAQIGDWLAELRGSEPAAAAEVGATLVALLQADELPSPPLVTNPAEAVRDPRETVDYAYRDLVEGLQRVTRRVADASTDRKRAELQFGELRAQPDPDPAQLDVLDRQAAEARAHERQLTGRSQWLAMRVDGFGTRKEAAKAMYTAAVASQEIQAAVAAAGSVQEDDASAAAEAVRKAAAELDSLLALFDRIRQRIWAEVSYRSGAKETVRRYTIWSGQGLAGEQDSAVQADDAGPIDDTG
jgi:hypothetical protein